MRSRHAYTLIELLMVIAVIAVLAGLLLPAVRLVKQSAQTVGCASNLRQIGTASLGYAQDYRGILPAGAAGGHPEFARLHFWPRTLAPYLGAEWEWDSPYTWNKSSTVVPVFSCPGNGYAANSWLVQQGKLLGIHYIIHSDMTNMWGANNASQATWSRLQKLPRPASITQMFIDMNTSGSSWGIELEHGDLWGYATGTVTQDPGMQVSFRHHKRCNAVMADGRIAQYYNPAMAVPVAQRWSHILGGPGL